MITLITTESVTFILLLVSEILPFLPSGAGGIIKTIFDAIVNYKKPAPQTQTTEIPTIVSS